MSPMPSPQRLPEHIPVMTEELLQGLDVIPGGQYVDCTVNGGGHAFAVLEASSPGGRLLGIDADSGALRVAERRLARHIGSFVLVNDNFANLKQVCKAYRLAPINGMYFDLGLSTLQLDDPSRGFSFQRDAALDMRFSDGQGTTAADIVNTYKQDDLARLIWTYGEEPASRAIARAIVRKRPIGTTSELAELVASAVRGPRGKIHPATRTFQALRIAVNDELGSLEKALAGSLEVLPRGGRVAVMSYHSLEDRVVKQWMQRESRDCICPPEVPVCVCGHKATLKILTKRVVTPSREETVRNPRSRSAKLRVAERI